MARLSGIPGIAVIRGSSSVALALAGSGASQDPSRDTSHDTSKMAVIRVTRSGLELRLALSKAQLRSPRLKKLSARTRPAMTHQTVLADASDLDEELLTWIKAARAEARTSKDRSS